MIELLNEWMLKSSGNFNVIIALITVLSFGSLLVLFLICRKFGRPDERTNSIYFKISSRVFIAQMIMNALFISLVDSDIEYFRQFFLLFQGIVFFIGAIYAFVLYRKDFK